jgi:hypothetical protein
LSHDGTFADGQGGGGREEGEWEAGEKIAKQNEMSGQKRRKRREGEMRAAERLKYFGVRSQESGEDVRRDAHHTCQ